ncbi:translation initiation factor eIF4G KNAG_0J02710 [Huiozyma naganishii CBS 8797]|uniref:MIF4G domain-containing protein n=1 Tax=Huiozyma naganishii (strain ATCC MYA-139 / BCRC 22969 / CBS 8797 / KCTC 17520 / NBRC 10181 / NCYC 3082 / Yp74L-3) TaxID=1071383 RepID=J7RBS5_HUIN7|nr:hypothetical protein KNAG_0J02710 [Kazachstania naganishii CBS 8797]CCK72350.1 hypothetical protein KNAG_0J02710 [Kazachstania naganishii CBS 8797]
MYNNGSTFLKSAPAGNGPVPATGAGAAATGPIPQQPWGAYPNAAYQNFYPQPMMPGMPPVGVGIPAMPMPTPSPTPSASASDVSQEPVESETDEEREEKKQKAEEVKKSFIEQVKARKAALEQKKLEEQRKKQEEEAARLKAEKDARDAAATEEEARLAKLKAEEDARLAEVKAQEDAKLKAEADARAKVEAEAKAEADAKAQAEAKEQEATSSPAETDGAVLTFAERMKLKKKQMATQEAQEGSTTPAADVPETTETAQQEVSADSPTDAQTETPTDATTDTPSPTDAPDEAPKEEEDEDFIPITKFLEILSKAKPLEDPFSFKYPEGFEGPEDKYKKAGVKYTYGPAFLLQFQNSVKVGPDAEWMKATGSRIVIPPGMARGNKSRDSGKFGSRNNSGNDFRSGSMRGDSRAGSKRRSKRDDRRDDRRSNRPRRDRSERGGSQRGDDRRPFDDTPAEPVAPFVPTANRWVPKSRAKKSEETEKKFAPDGVTELFEQPEIERKMKSLLNKLTLEKFDPISAEILTLANLSKWESRCETLTTVIEQIFFKACDEPHWSSMYAQLCGKVVKDLDPEITDESNTDKTGPKLVLHYLVIRCHTEFEKGWTDNLPTNEDGTPLAPELMSDEYYKLAAAKRRGLGLVRFIGHLYRLNLLTGKMMFECFRRLMKDLNNHPSEEVLESVVELLETVGEQFERDSFRAGPATLEGSALLDTLFTLLQQIMETTKISNRIKFKLMDVVELRGRNWRSNKKDQGPMTIAQIHEEEERQRALKQMQQNNSRSGSRRSMRDNSNRNSFRREPSQTFSKDKDNFLTKRSFSQQKQKPQQKEEAAPIPSSASTNMFSALMDNNSDSE